MCIRDRYYGWDTDADENAHHEAEEGGSSGSHRRSPLMTLEVQKGWMGWTLDPGRSTYNHFEWHVQVMSRLNLNLTFTAVSSLVTLWLRALSADPLQKARMKRFHQSYNTLLYAGSFTLELLGLVGGEAMKDLTFFSTLWTSGMALGYLLGACECIGCGRQWAMAQVGRLIDCQHTIVYLYDRRRGLWAASLAGPAPAAARPRAVSLHPQLHAQAPGPSVSRVGDGIVGSDRWIDQRSLILPHPPFPPQCSPSRWWWPRRTFSSWGSSSSA